MRDALETVTGTMYCAEVSADSVEEALVEVGQAEAGNRRIKVKVLSV